MALLKTNTGIGTTNPTSALHVIGDGLFTGVVTATTFSGQINSGVGTFTNLIATNATLTNINSSGITTLGVTTVTRLTAQSINSSGIVTGSTFRPSTGYIQAADGTNSFYIYDGTGNVAFQGTIGASQVNNASGFKVIGFAGTDITFENNAYVAGVTTSVGGFVGNLTGTASTASFATTAYNLTDAANITAGTINPARLSGTYDIDISGNAATATYATSAGVATYASNAGVATYADAAGIATYATNAGVATYASNAGIATNVIGGIASVSQIFVSGVTTSVGGFVGDLTGTATTATKLQNIRTFEITGDVVASPISFDGTGNVSLAATIQPNSVALGSDTTGDYVQTITGTSNQITVTGGTGEGSTPTLSIPNQFTVPQDIEVTRDLQVNRNLNVNGNITIGGTSATIFSQSLNIFDPDIILGYRTDAFGNDVSNDNTANHGGVAVASTEGTPLVQLFIAGIETNPATYKKIMWFKAGEFAGLGTDAWLMNYAVGIGSTQFPTGTRLAAGSVQITENDLAVVRNINASGIVTAVQFIGTASTASFATTAFTLNGVTEGNLSVGFAQTAGVSTSVIGGIASVTQLSVSGISTFSDNVFVGTGITMYAATGIISATAFYGNGQNLSDIIAAKLAGVSILDEGIQVGSAFQFSELNFVGDYVAAAGVGSTSTITFTTPPYANVAGLATYATSAGVATNVIGGIASVTQLSVSGISTLGVVTAGNIFSTGIVTALSFVGNLTGTATTASFATTAFTLDGVTASNLSVNFARTAGVATYATLAGVSTDVIGGIASVTQLSVSGVSTFAGITTVTGDTLFAKQLNVSGVTTSIGGFVGNLTGTASTASFATTSYNLVDANNILSGTINVARLTGTYDININGNATTASYAPVAGVATYATNAGVATYATNAGIATNLKGGSAGNVPYQSAVDTTTFVPNGTTGQVLLFNGSIPVWGNVTAASGAFGGISVQDEGTPIGTANSVTTLDFRGGNVVVTATTGANGIATIRIADNLVGTGLSISGISTIGNFRITPVGSGATVGGIGVTYFGDGSNLTGVSGGISISTNTTNQTQYIPYAISFGSTTGFGATTTLSFNPSTGIFASPFFTGNGSLLSNTNGFSTSLSSDPSSPLYRIYKETRRLNVTAGVHTVQSDSESDNLAFTKADIIVVSTGATFQVSSGTTFKTNIIDLFPADQNLDVTADNLNVLGVSTFAGIATHTASLFGIQASFAGVVTASSFSGNASSATYASTAGIATYADTAGIATYASTAGIATYATNAGVATYSSTAGIATVSQGLTGTPNINVGIITAISASFSGNVSIAGTLTYEDVTNVDSLGIVTARSGVLVGNPTSIGATITSNGDASFSGIVTASTLSGSLQNTLTLNTSGTGLSGSTTFNNSGAATFTVTSNATSNNTSSTIVARDASGNFSAGTITANLTGTASTASFATTSYNLTDAANITTGTINSARLSGTYNIDISGNAVTATYATNAGIATNLKGGAGGQIVYQSATDTTAFLTNGTSGQILQSNGGTNAPSWIANGVGVATAGGTVGTGATILDFRGAGISTVTVAAGIATINIGGGGGNISIADDTSTNATYYVGIANTTTGNLSTLNVSSTKLTFNPSTGNLIVGGTVTANSDQKLKTDVQTIENALDKVLSLRGVEFTRIDNGDKQIGVIAQEVEEVIPEVVYPKQPAPNNETKSVAYGNIVGLLIEAIKEQNKEIQELKRKLEEG